MSHPTAKALKGLGNSTFYQTAGGGPIEGYVNKTKGDNQGVYFIHRGSPFGDWKCEENYDVVFRLMRYDLPYLCVVSQLKYQEMYLENRRRFVDDAIYQKASQSDRDFTKMMVQDRIREIIVPSLPDVDPNEEETA